MSVANDLSSVLNQAEESDFIRYLSRKNKRHDTRNTALFKAMLSNNSGQIKQEIGSNAFNALSKRLADRLEDYIAEQAIAGEVTDEIKTIKQLLVSRRMFSHGKYRTAFKLLKRAEKQATELLHYSLLNEIYHTAIQYSYSEFAPTQEELFSKLQFNMEQLMSEERLNMAYAAIRKAFYARKEDDTDLNALLRENFDRFGISQNKTYSFQTLYHLAQIMDMAGEYRKDYHALDIFFIDELRALQGGTNDSEKFLLYHIDILHMLANIYFRKKDFARSLSFLDEMNNQMRRFESKFYELREVQHTTLKALNLNFSGGHSEAKKILEEMLSNFDGREEELLNVRLSLAMIHFQQGDLKAVKEQLRELYRSDGWYERYQGIAWVLNKKYMEILLYIELGDVDYVDSRIQSLIRKYSDQFKKATNNQVLPFLKLVKRYYHEPDIAKTERFRAEVEGTIDWKPIQEEDIFFMCFYAWLKSKMEGRAVYDVTLELVHRKQ